MPYLFVITNVYYSCDKYIFYKKVNDSCDIEMWTVNLTILYVTRNVNDSHNKFICNKVKISCDIFIYHEKCEQFL